MYVKTIQLLVRISGYDFADDFDSKSMYSAPRRFTPNFPGPRGRPLSEMITSPILTFYLMNPVCVPLMTF